MWVLQESQLEDERGRHGSLKEESNLLRRKAQLLDQVSVHTLGLHGSVPTVGSKTFIVSWPRVAFKTSAPHLLKPNRCLFMLGLSVILVSF